MKKLRNSIISLLLSVVAVLGCVNLPFFKVSALSQNYYTSSFNSDEVIYYFSDSAPAFAHMFSASDPVIYDTHFLMSAQEFAFLVYTGYFWGFNQEKKNIVIIELKTTRPDPVVLANLYICLKAQECKVFYISPYISEGFESGYDDPIMVCNFDKFSRYLKNCVRGMLDESGELRNGTSILISGGFFGLNSATEMPTLFDLSKSSGVFRRLLHYMQYNCDEDAEATFEESLYRQLWQIHCTTYFSAYGGAELDYFDGDNDIINYINVWKSIEQQNSSTLDEFYNTDNLDRVEYLERCNNSISNYYTGVLQNLYNKDVHILANTNETTFVDLVAYYYGRKCEVIFGQTVFSFLDYESIAGNFELNTHYFYTMAFLPVSQDFYNLLMNIQKVMPNTAQYAHINRIPWVWSDIPITLGPDGLVIMLEDDLQELYGHKDCACPECAEYDQQYLESTFLAELEELTI